MTTQEKQKLNEKLAKWAGWILDRYGDWHTPIGVEVSEIHPYPKFPDSLDACFKWLVPKLYELGWEYELKGYTYHIANLYKDERRIESRGEKDPALALCLAIEMLIEVIE